MDEKNMCENFFGVQSNTEIFLGVQSNTVAVFSVLFVFLVS